MARDIVSPDIVRGKLASVKNATAPGSIVLASNTPTDLPGYSLTFSYAGLPIMIVAAMPLRFSVATASLQLKVVDVGTSKQVHTEMQVSPSVANTTFTGKVHSNPITALADGTALVVGQSYTWKIQIQAPAGTYQSPVAANTEFYGHYALYEV